MAKEKAATRARTKRGKRAPTARKAAKTSTKRWSAQVMKTSNALDLEAGVFTKRTARQVALSLKRSADRSGRRKSSPFRSAMSMLTFHINRAGHGLSAARKRVLTQAKDELRRLYDEPEGGTAKRTRN